jgi:ribosomal protein L37E
MANSSLWQLVDKLSFSCVIYSRGIIMPGCPNCGRETQRTEDWVCQWCGYPLLSRAYRKIDKTYKQLQEERRHAWALTEPEEEPELEPEAVAEPEPEPEQEPEPEPEAATEPEPEPELEEKPKRKRKSKSKPKAEAEPGPEAELEPEIEPEPEPETKPSLEPKLEATSGEIEISAGELNAIFQEDRLAANEKLKGKILSVTGLVDKVFVRDHLDIRYIVLTGTDKSIVWKVRCVFGKESVSQMNRLAERQEVTVRGKYDGYGQNIVMKDCVLVS